MATIHECPECACRVIADTTSAGAFDVPPKLSCQHIDEGEAYRMVVVD